MRKPIEMVGRRLLLRGLPLGYVRRTIRELDEHVEDLMHESPQPDPTEAERLALERLGDLRDLEDRLCNTLQRTSWSGRHPIITFVFLPPLLIIVWWGVFAMLAGWVSGAFQWTNNHGRPQPDWAVLLAAFHWNGSLLAVVPPFVWCVWARRKACGFKWSLVACLSIGLHDAMQAGELVPPTHAKPPSFWVGYNFMYPNLAEFAPPLVVFLLFVLFALNQRKSLETS